MHLEYRLQKTLIILCRTLNTKATLRILDIKHHTLSQYIYQANKQIGTKTLYHLLNWVRRVYNIRIPILQINLSEGERMLLQLMRQNDLYIKEIARKFGLNRKLLTNIWAQLLDKVGGRLKMMQVFEYLRHEDLGLIYR